MAFDITGKPADDLPNVGGPAVSIAAMRRQGARSLAVVEALRAKTEDALAKSLMAAQAVGQDLALKVIEPITTAINDADSLIANMAGVAGNTMRATMQGIEASSPLAADHAESVPTAASAGMVAQSGAVAGEPLSSTPSPDLS